MKTIIIPTDFSACANEALRYAVGFADSQNEDVHLALLHVLNMPIPATDIPLSYFWETMESQKTEAKARLKQLVERYHATAPQLGFSIHVPFGDLLTEAEILVAEKKADMVIMGTLGASGILDKLLGSNASTLALELRCNVLVVPPGHTFEPYKTIVFGADLDKGNAHELAYTVQLAERSDARLVVAHVEAVDARIRTRLMNDLWDSIKKANSYRNAVFVSTYSSDIEKGLLKLIKKEHADLLVVSPRSDSFWDLLFHNSHTRHLLLQPRLPILCLKQHYSPDATSTFQAHNHYTTL